MALESLRIWRARALEAPSAYKGEIFTPIFSAWSDGAPGPCLTQYRPAPATKGFAPGAMIGGAEFSCSMEKPAAAR
jgi:hypothetical protein